MERGEFFVGMELLQHKNNFKWEAIIVYGSADHSRAGAFQSEQAAKVKRAMLSVVVGGVCNLLKEALDKKNNFGINIPLMSYFNDCIESMGLQELDQIGARFTWTNKQANPVMNVLDRVLVSADWE